MQGRAGLTSWESVGLFTGLSVYLCHCFASFLSTRWQRQPQVPLSLVYSLPIPPILPCRGYFRKTSEPSNAFQYSEQCRVAKRYPILDPKERVIIALLFVIPGKQYFPCCCSGSCFKTLLKNVTVWMLSSHPVCWLRVAYSQVTLQLFQEFPDLRVYNLCGGIISWYNSGEVVVDCNGDPIESIHPFEPELEVYITRPNALSTAQQYEDWDRAYLPMFEFIMFFVLDRTVK